MIPAVHSWADNGALIRDAASLGYVHGDVLDVTYGLGKFWTRYQPESFTGVDLNPAKSLTGQSVDFTNLPYDDCSFDTVIYDPPYKLNGTPTESVDARYGVEVATRWQDRMALCLEGLQECCRVSARFVLAKCQDQVCSGKVRWQTIEFVAQANFSGFDLEDRFDLLGTSRPQPMNGRVQKHAHGRPSTLLVFSRR